MKGTTYTGEKLNLKKWTFAYLSEIIWNALTQKASGLINSLKYVW